MIFSRKKSPTAVNGLTHEKSNNIFSPSMPPKHIFNPFQHNNFPYHTELGLMQKNRFQAANKDWGKIIGFREGGVMLKGWSRIHGKFHLNICLVLLKLSL